MDGIGGKVVGSLSRVREENLVSLRWNLVVGTTFFPILVRNVVAGKQTTRKLSEILMQSCRRNPEIVQKLDVFVLNETIFVLNLVADWGSGLTDLS